MEREAIAPRETPSEPSAELLLSWDFENVVSVGPISMAAGTPSHPAEVTGLVAQTGGGPAEVFANVGTVFLTRHLGTHEPFLWVVSSRPLHLEALTFRHWHNHNPRFPTYKSYEVRLQLDRGDGCRDVSPPLTLSDANSGSTDTLPLGVSLPAGRYRLRWHPSGLKRSQDTKSEFFAVRDVRLTGRLLDADPAPEESPPRVAEPEPSAADGLGSVSAVIRGNKLVEYVITGAFRGKPRHRGKHDWEYDSWRLVKNSAQVILEFDRPRFEGSLSVEIVWAGWGEQTRVDLSVNGESLAENLAVGGSAWNDPAVGVFAIPERILLPAGNALVLELSRKSQMAVFLRSFTLRQLSASGPSLE